MAGPLNPLTDPLGPCWVRLKGGRVKLTDDAIDAFKAILMLLLQESVDAEASAHRAANCADDTRALEHARYFSHVRGFIRSTWPRIQQRFGTREIESMRKLIKVLGEGLPDV